MTRRTIGMIVVAMALTAIGAEGAAAQAPPPPTFGGGRLEKIGPFKGYTPTVNLSLQPRGARIAMLFDSSVR